MFFSFYQKSDLYGELFSICLNKPTEIEWNACLYGYIIHVITRREDFYDKLGLNLINNSDLAKSYCDVNNIYYPWFREESFNTKLLKYSHA